MNSLLLKENHFNQKMGKKFILAKQKNIIKKYSYFYNLRIELRKFINKKFFRVKINAFQASNVSLLNI